MRFRIFTEPQQGADYETLLSVARAAERLGFDAFFRSDHFLSMGEGDGLPGPSDAWTSLAGLARDTERIRLGTLVSSATFRHPAILAIQAANVDEMSGGRVELGLGTGWFAEEHSAYGIPFPEKRFGLLEEQLEVISGLWYADGPFSHSGAHYTLKDAPALPKPVQERVPVIIGGTGPRRTPAIAARFATEYNVGFTLDPLPAFERTRAACEAIGRDPGSLGYSLALTTVVGETDAAYARRAEAIGRDPRRFTESGLGGTPARVVDELGRLAETGIDTVYLQIMDLGDLEHLELIAAEVVPAFR